MIIEIALGIIFGVIGLVALFFGFAVLVAMREDQPHNFPYAAVLFLIIFLTVVAVVSPW